MPPRYPSLFQVNTRVRLAELSQRIGRPATFDDIPDAEIDLLAERGYDWVWFLGVWQTGDAGRQVAVSDPGLQDEYRRALPDFTSACVAGSCFAIQDYRADDGFGGDEALNRLRERLHARGIRLMLDFVPNHVALDHPWAHDHPEYFVAGDEAKLAAEPGNYARIQTARGERILAHGRDPYFPGWTDTLQLNYANPELCAAMTGELQRAARSADGFRCDMAMLLLPDVFERTWGLASQPFWPGAIEAVRASRPDFLFLAEVYWDLEGRLQQDGFDYCYDKRLYDLLCGGQARPLQEHLSAGLNYQGRLARFLENHDEPRAAAMFPLPLHRAAAILTFLSPGMRFFHEGQREGKRVRLPVQLLCAPEEPEDPEIRAFYDRLQGVLKRDAVRNGDWQLLECRAAWGGNPTAGDFIAFSWRGWLGERLVAAVNYSGHQSQCYVRLPFAELAGEEWRFHDLTGPAEYDRDGDDLARRGLYLDLPAWGYHVFELKRC